MKSQGAQTRQQRHPGTGFLPNGLCCMARTGPATTPLLGISHGATRASHEPQLLVPRASALCRQGSNPSSREVGALSSTPTVSGRKQQLWWPSNTIPVTAGQSPTAGPAGQCHSGCQPRTRDQWPPSLEISQRPSAHPFQGLLATRSPRNQAGPGVLTGGGRLFLAAVSADTDRPNAPEHGQAHSTAPAPTPPRSTTSVNCMGQGGPQLATARHQRPRPCQANASITSQQQPPPSAENQMQPL